MSSSLRFLSWNLQWTTPNSVVGCTIASKIAQADADVVCLTELRVESLPKGGSSILSDADYGYPHPGNRRKVALWSRLPWERVDVFGHALLPPGRFVSGVAAGIRVIGICVPWRNAHVSTGRKDRKPWEDHCAFLHGLAEAVQNAAVHAGPCVLLGDFNQRIPGWRQCPAASAALREVLNTGFTVVTEGLSHPERGPLIDHLAVRPRLKAEVERLIEPRTPEGRVLSDHVGFVVRIECEVAELGGA